MKQQTFIDCLRDFLQGMAAWEFERKAIEMQRALENVFLAVTLGDTLGLPVLPPIYSLRLLPYVMPSISTHGNVEYHGRGSCRNQTNTTCTECEAQRLNRR